MAACGLVLPASVPAQSRLLIEYRDKPPYSHTVANQPAGFLIERTVRILRAAGFAADYKEIPVKRILQDVQDNRAPICSPGWYRLPEREKFARFSLPISHDRPHVVLAHADAARSLGELDALSELLSQEAWTLGVLDGVSYGEKLDAAIAAVRRPVVRAMLSPGQLARMIAARRADFMLIDQEDLAWMQRDPDYAGLNLVRLEFADMPSGLPRHLMCSQQVDAAQMERLNQAIRQLGLDAPPRRP